VEIAVVTSRSRLSSRFCFWTCSKSWTEERGRRLRGDRLEVVVGEGAVALVEELDHADDLVAARADRGAEDVVGAVAGLLVDLLVEAGVGVGFGDEDRLAAREDGAGDADVARDADLAGEAALRDARVAFARLADVEEDGAPVGAHRLVGDLDDALEDHVERHRVERREEISKKAAVSRISAIL
jgi:hypothetical protein